MSDDERPPRPRQDPRRDAATSADSRPQSHEGGYSPKSPGPPSSRPPSSVATRDAGPASTRGDPPGGRPKASADDRLPSSARAQGGARGDEIAGLYRKVADLQAELADTEARLERAHAESAGADEMVGQMLARVSEAEARLRQAAAEASARLGSAEARAADLAMQLGKARREVEAREADIAAARQDAEDARAEVSARRAEIEALQAKLLRQQEERETLGLRVAEFAKVLEERDGALVREEVLEAELEEARAEADRLREAHTAELAAALRREEEVAARAGPGAAMDADRVAALSAERDALAVEARHLRAAVEGVAGALAELQKNLGGHGPSAPASPAEHDDEPPITPRMHAGSPGSLLLRMGSEDDEATKVFGALEMELARSTTGPAEPGGSPGGSRGLGGEAPVGNRGAGG